MEFKYFSHNGTLKPVEEAVIPLSNIEYQYGFGVYESIRVAGGTPRFLDDHLARLQESARAIGLEHSFSNSSIYGIVQELIEKNAVETCNLKILLIGGPSTSFDPFDGLRVAPRNSKGDKTQDKSLGVNKTKEGATLYILCLNPVFPDKKLYRDGVKCITHNYERAFPHAKTLNMLGSYLAYRKAKHAGAYDALLINRDGYITEGTRTNFFCIQGKTIISPREGDILPGVTRKMLMRAISGNGYTFKEGRVAPSDVKDYDGAFLTSTSSKILPIRMIDEIALPVIPEVLRELMILFDAFLAQEGKSS